MEDMLQETKNSLTGCDLLDKQAATLGELLREHNGQNVSVMDLREINNWTDFFIIATVSSKTHMDGLERHIKEHCRLNEIEILGNSRRSQDDEWRLIDLGFTIIHLMTGHLREFYDLERLWGPIP
ncbi:MAG: ribosome silencing factor [Treponema sp.]|jgi:ribosome-associated protein|nr:ribosome silencing factor [Treponema sp.]